MHFGFSEKFRDHYTAGHVHSQIKRSRDRGTQTKLALRYKQRLLIIEENFKCPVKFTIKRKEKSHKNNLTVIITKDRHHREIRTMLGVERTPIFLSFLTSSLKYKQYFHKMNFSKETHFLRRPIKITGYF